MLPFIRSDLTINGIPLSFMTHRDDMAIGKCLRAGVSADIHLATLKSHLKPHARVLDAGANIGLTSIYMAKSQPSATIYAFEPDPLNYSLLNVNLALNNVTNVLTFNCALGKRRQYLSFYKNSLNHGDHRNSKPAAGEAAYFSKLPASVLTVNPAEFLEECLGDERPLYFDLVKIDTQGADLDILEACLPLIRPHSVVIAEYSPTHLKRYGTRKTDVDRIVGRFSRIEKIHYNPPLLKHEIQMANLLADYDAIPGYYDIVLSQKSHFNAYEQSVRSQNGEDGLIAHLVSAVGTANRYFVEFGTGGGLENNTAKLILQDRWGGLLIEGNEALHKRISALYAPYLQVKILNRFITKENIESIFQSAGVPAEFDLLSIDIDGNDYWVWQALHGYKPRIVVVEYNASYPPPKKMVIAYDPKFVWRGTSYFGASLASLAALGSKLGYALVGTDSRGVNAFFVRRDLLDRSGLRETSPEEAYHYPNYGRYRGGHIPMAGPLAEGH